MAQKSYIVQIMVTADSLGNAVRAFEDEIRPGGWIDTVEIISAWKRKEKLGGGRE